VAWLPFTEEQLQRAFLVLILAGAAALAWFVAGLAGLPAVLQGEFARLAGNAGFEVRHVQVTGIERMNELRVYERAYRQRERPMPLVDLDALREELLAMPYVRDARVSRRLPDRLVVDIVERQPHAVLAKAGKLFLIDETGQELSLAGPKQAREWLLVSGPGAQREVAALNSLLDTAPALKTRVVGAEWVGNRRWNVTFDTGQILALPQGETRADNAFIAFARLDGMYRLIGGRPVSIDMRDPTRLYLRCDDGPCSDRPGLAVSS
jgi:cell division protein FtsQ